MSDDQGKKPKYDYDEFGKHAAKILRGDKPDAKPKDREEGEEDKVLYPFGREKAEQPATMLTYSMLQRAYDHFNAELFGGVLPKNVLISLTRRVNMEGRLKAGVYQNRKGVRSAELVINSTMFRNTRETLAVMVRQMVHLKQWHMGRPPQTEGYHNEQWADWMIQVGLRPIPETGSKVRHVIEKLGPFDRSCRRLMTADFNLEWAARVGEANEPLPSKEEKEKKARRRWQKYQCPTCGFVCSAPKGTTNLLCDGIQGKKHTILRMHHTGRNRDDERDDDED